jgi:serine/threonine protein kinase
VRLLGTGAFGEVLHCTSKPAGEECAVKRSKKAYKRPFERLRSLREVQNLEAIPVHPHIIGLQMCWEEQVCDHFLFKINSVKLINEHFFTKNDIFFIN